eukprot:c8711_g1_i1.p1 GENE.c8711_g1_i1~~c8711_g1_i1.p1  ORF type:complete len:494 (+),score=118.31 c8711_g1_i1:174-1484(+)
MTESAKEKAQSVVDKSKEMKDSATNFWEKKGLSEKAKEYARKAMKGAGFGAIGGTIGAVLGAKVHGQSGVEVLHSALTGAVTGAVAAAATPTNYERTNPSEGDEVMKATTFGAAIGTASYFGGGSAGSETTDRVTARIGSGIGGALLGQYFTRPPKGKLSDALLGYDDLKVAFGGLDELTADDVQSFAKLTRDEAAELLNKVSGSDRTESISTMDLAFYLDLQNNGSIDVDDLTTQLFSGDKNRAARFMLKALPKDKKVINDLSLDRDEVDMEQFFKFVQLAAGGYDYCKSPQSCVLDPSALQALTHKLDQSPTVSFEQAKQRYNVISHSLDESGVAVSRAGLSYQNLVAFLSQKQDPTDVTLTQSDLARLFDSKHIARRLVDAYEDFQIQSLDESQREASHLRQKFAKLHPFSVVRKDVAEEYFAAKDSAEPEKK